MKKKILTTVCITIVLILCFFIGLYILGIKGQAYKIASKYIEGNRILSENIGPLEYQRLSIFGYSVRDSGSHGYAEYEILVRGKKDKGTVYIELEKPAGIWKVSRANLVTDDGTKVFLGGDLK